VEDESDAEMREIFIEEAREVVEGAREALFDLNRNHQDTSAMTVIRRAFHTLKGSSRMVGLREFGEAAWACEQLCNARLADAVLNADAPLRNFINKALDMQAAWIERIAQGHIAGTGTAEFIAEADSLRTGSAAPVGKPLDFLSSVTIAPTLPALATEVKHAVDSAPVSTQVGWMPLELACVAEPAPEPEPIAANADEPSCATEEPPPPPAPTPSLAPLPATQETPTWAAFDFALSDVVDKPELALDLAPESAPDTLLLPDDLPDQAIQATELDLSDIDLPLEFAGALADSLGLPQPPASPEPPPSPKPSATLDFVIEPTGEAHSVTTAPAAAAPKLPAATKGWCSILSCGANPQPSTPRSRHRRRSLSPLSLRSNSTHRRCPPRLKRVLTKN